MVLHILRALFILMMAAVAWSNLELGSLTLAFTLSLAILFVGIDILSPRSKLAIFSGVLFGLVVGIAVAYALQFVVKLVLDHLSAVMDPKVVVTRGTFEKFINLVITLVCCYLSISFVLQTKDDFRFSIPYVEFSKKLKGARPMILDTSVLIDGRIGDIASTGILESQLVVPRFVLQELQSIADSGDKLKRNRGRRGLDMLAKLRSEPRAEVILYEGHVHDANHDAAVDEELMALAKELSGRVLTNDYNLNKIAQLRGVDVININDLSHALKPVVLPGERMTVKLIKPGEAAGQGVGYLDDGTMVVVEQGRSHLNQDVEFTVTSALQTSAGRMIFGRLMEGSHSSPGGSGSSSPTSRRHHGRGESGSASAVPPSTTSNPT